MAKPVAKTAPHQSMTLLSRLLLKRLDEDETSLSAMAELKAEARNISREEFDELVGLANSNHVIVRGMEAFLDMMQAAKDDPRAAWAQSALTAERARIATALAFLEEVCCAFEYEKYDVAVIKSLDHWPDLGSDLDLYTDVSSEAIVKVMSARFDAQIAPRAPTRGACPRPRNLRRRRGRPARAGRAAPSPGRVGRPRRRGRVPYAWR